MKKILGRNIRVIVESALLVLGLLMLVIMMGTSSMEIGEQSYNIWERGFSSFTSYTGECITIILFFVLAFADIISILLTILKRRSTYIVGIVFNIVVVVGVFVANNYYSFLNGGDIACLVFSIVFTLLGIAYHVVCLILNRESFQEKEINLSDNDKKLRLSKISKYFILVCSILSVVGTLSTLFIPLYVMESSSGTIINYVPVNALINAKQADLPLFFTFIGLFLLNIVNITFFLSNLGYIKNYDSLFVRKSKDLIYVDFGMSIVYFIVGVCITFFNNQSGYDVNTYTYIFFIIMSVIMILFSVVSINWLGEKENKKEKHFPKVEMLVYLTIFTAASVLSIFMKLLVVSLNGTEQISLKAYDIIKDHASLSGSYQLLAFFIVMMGIICLSLFVISITTFFRNKSLFYKTSMVTILFNVLFVFALGTFGIYYQIVQAMNEEQLVELFAHYGFTYSSPTYTIKSQTMYLFFATLGLLILVLIRNPLKDIPEAEFNIQGVTGGGVGGGSGQASQSQQEGVTFDACPSFSELDSKKPYFDKALQERKEHEFVDPSLPSVTKFIVDYARESRLHLSYSQEDIATFIAGLGACRLTILQGMSGTGKTSLPKIFSEAIMGNCDIIEVESSWRDKNELLGYYNEFSKTFTPKKFTQALYKAKLNDEIPTFIVLDEMNLSRIEYYFSDFLSLMENEEGKREIKLLNVKLYNTMNDVKKSYLGLSEDHTIKIPSNIWFIGTANRDESTFEISDKVYDRAHTMNFNKRAPKANPVGSPLNPQYLPYEVFINLINNAKNSYEFDVDKNHVIKEVERILSPYNISFGNRIYGQIENFVKVYCSCFNEPSEKEFEAVEKIVLSKVVAKLENKSVENKEVLIAEFNKLKLKSCAEFVSKLNED